MQAEILFSLAAIGILGISCQWLAWFVRLPAILFLLIVGIIAGPVSGLLNPDDLFGKLLLPIVSLSVAIILFEGSLTLKLEEIKGLAKVVRNLVTLGAIITWLITAFGTHYILGFDLKLALLFGAVVVVTGPTVIIPMLRTVRPNAKIANILRWEGIVIDPLGALLAVLVFDFIVATQADHIFANVLFIFGKILLVGIVTGSLSALALGYILRNHFIPEYLRNVLSLSLVATVFVCADLIAHESGLLAVTVMGMVLANMKDTDISDILDFKESLSIILISGLFIILAARIQLDELILLGWPALTVLLLVMFIARPLAVFASSIGSDLSFKEKFLISWIGPRGIVAAAVAAIFAFRLEQAGQEYAELLVPLTFMVIIGTVVFQSATAKMLARWLKVREPAPTGFLIIGAGNLARAIACVLRDNNFKVTLTDSNWENTRQARMEGLECYYGNPISEHADTHLDLTGIGRMLAISGRTNVDALACLRFKTEFGLNNLYELTTNSENNIADKHRISGRHRGQALFGEAASYGRLAGWLRNGAEIKSTQLSGEFSFSDYLNNYKDRCIPLFCLDPKHHLHVFTDTDSVKPEPGCIILGLIYPEDAPVKAN